MGSEKMEPIRLEPCPFCGKPGTIDEEHSKANPERVVFVPSCSDPDCVGVLLQTFARRSEAATAWNTRAHQSGARNAAWAEKAAEAVAGFVATYWVNGKPCPVCNGDASECQHTFPNMLAAIIRQHAPQSQGDGEGK